MKGIGFLYCAKELIPSLKPHTACRQSLTRWHRPPLERHADELPWRSDARIFESGNPNYIGIAAMGKGVGLLNELGPEAIEMHVLEMELKLRTLCADLPLHFYTPKNQRNYSGVVFVTLPEGVSNEAADAVFVKHKVYATIREGYIRIAIHCMNSEKHMQMTADALKEVAALTAK
jgi:selenocysteine lyase/cysteine desulfurase